MAQVQSMWALNESENMQGSVTVTVWTEKTRLVRYFLYLWVQVQQEDFSSTKFSI